MLVKGATVRCMDNFYVVGSNLSFPVSHPGILNGTGYQLCGKYPGTPPLGQVSRVTCQPGSVKARLVYMQVGFPTSPACLELCEVWVIDGKYDKHSRTYPVMDKGNVCCESKSSPMGNFRYIAVGHNTVLTMISLVWRHNERDGVSNPQRLDCLLNHLFRRRSKKNS